MKHRLLTALALTAIACAAVAATATAGTKANKLFQFRGELLGASATSVQIQVEGGNHAALRAMLGQSQNQTFAVGSTTEFLIWAHGVPKIGTVADLKQGDWVSLNVRGKAGSSLQTLEGGAAKLVGDHTTKGNPSPLPLYLFAGAVAGPQAGGHIAMNVSGGNARALRAMVGQPSAQTFAYGDDTIFLLWQGRVPTVVDASQLKAGDRITIRVRAPKASTLAQVEATAAVHVGDHEPANSNDAS
jgi:hypothetical protein